MMPMEVASSIAFALLPLSILGLCISWGRHKEAERP